MPSEGRRGRWLLCFSWATPLARGVISSLFRMSALPRRSSHEPPCQRQNVHTRDKPRRALRGHAPVPVSHVDLTIAALEVRHVVSYPLELIPQ
jgi:hypothetical protein